MQLISSDILKIIRDVFEVNVKVYNKWHPFHFKFVDVYKRGLEFMYCYPYISVPNIHENLLLFIL